MISDNTSAVLQPEPQQRHSCTSVKVGEWLQVWQARQAVEYIPGLLSGECVAQQSTYCTLLKPFCMMCIAQHATCLVGR